MSPEQYEGLLRFIRESDETGALIRAFQLDPSSIGTPVANDEVLERPFVTQIMVESSDGYSWGPIAGTSSIVGEGPIQGIRIGGRTPKQIEEQVLKIIAEKGLSTSPVVTVIARRLPAVPADASEADAAVQDVQRLLEADRDTRRTLVTQRDILQAEFEKLTPAESAAQAQQPGSSVRAAIIALDQQIAAVDARISGYEERIQQELAARDRKQPR
jgi:hypothetical protein